MLTPWKESDDQPRQHSKQQRHYFVNKGPSSQGYGFSSGHVWMWELDYKESWWRRKWEPTPVFLPGKVHEQSSLAGCSPWDSQESSPTPQFKSINSSLLSLLYSPTLISIHDHWKIIALTRWTFVGKVMSLLFNMLSRLVITFLPRSKCLLISWLQI